MAFPSAGGYANLPSGNFTPEIFSQKVLKFFRRASVVEDITNTDYAGEIDNYGDTVRIIKEPTITVSAYSRGSTVTPQNLADDETTMVVDQANAFAFKIDDIEERQSHVNFEALVRLAFALAAGTSLRITDTDNPVGGYLLCNHKATLLVRFQVVSDNLQERGTSDEELISTVFWNDINRGANAIDDFYDGARELVHDIR